MPSNTALNIGVRRFIRGTVNDYRNFQPGGTTQYVCNKAGMSINGVAYSVGDALPLGALPDATLEVLFDEGSINPAS